MEETGGGGEQLYSGEIGLPQGTFARRPKQSTNQWKGIVLFWRQSQVEKKKKKSCAVPAP